jgi:hypothetical protein
MLARPTPHRYDAPMVALRGERSFESEPDHAIGVIGRSALEIEEDTCTSVRLA